MQVIGRKIASVAAQVVDVGLIGRLGWPHPGLVGKVIAFPEVAAGAGCDDIFPSGQPAFGPRNDVVESKIVRSPTVLANKSITKKYIESREGGKFCRPYVILERD